MIEAASEADKFALLCSKTTIPLLDEGANAAFNVKKLLL